MFRSLRESLRQYFLQETAEREASSRSREQQIRIRDFVKAGDARLSAADSLRRADQVPAALVLQRDGIVLIVRALLEAHAKEGSDQTAEQAFRSLALLVESGELGRAPDGFDEVRALLTDTRPLAFDELPAPEALEKRANVDVTSRWLRGLVDARSPRQIKLSRALRLGTIGLVVLLGIAFGVKRVVQPKNLALGKPVQSSSRRPHCPVGSGQPGLPPYGLVDGNVGDVYDICTGPEVRPWATVDLQTVRRIGKIVVYHRADCCWGNYDLPAVLELSKDGVAFREVARRKTVFTAREPWVATLDDSARFVRYRVDSDGTGEVVLNELEVYGP